MKSILLALLLISTSANAGMWQLINQQFSVNTWYCTYQLQGTTIQTTIESRTYCQSFIFKP